MSFIDFEQLSPQETILNYLIEVRGRGFFFPYSDMVFIDTWIRMCPDFNELLVILGETAPIYFQILDKGYPKGPRTLRGYHSIVIRKIKDRLTLGMDSMQGRFQDRNEAEEISNDAK